jgi:hypothetical protein
MPRPAALRASHVARLQGVLPPSPVRASDSVATAFLVSKRPSAHRRERANAPTPVGRDAMRFSARRSIVLTLVDPVGALNPRTRWYAIVLQPRVAAGVVLVRWGARSDDRLPATPTAERYEYFM